MRDIRMVLELEKVIPIAAKDGKDPELKVSKMIDEMIEKEKENNTYLSSFEVNKSEFERIEEGNLMFTLVKKAIDSYDPYFVHPDSYDEYDGESRNIAEKIIIGMSIDEIAEIMKEEFNFSFSPDFEREDFYESAEAVYNLLEDSIDKPIIKDGVITKKDKVYVKLTLCKVIPVKALEKEDGIMKAIKIVFDKIDSDKETKSDLSSFNISVSYNTQDIS